MERPSGSQLGKTGSDMELDIVDGAEKSLKISSSEALEASRSLDWSSHMNSSLLRVEKSYELDEGLLPHSEL